MEWRRTGGDLEQSWDQSLQFRISRRCVWLLCAYNRELWDVAINLFSFFVGLCLMMSKQPVSSTQKILAGSLETLTYCLTLWRQKNWELGCLLPSLASLQPRLVHSLFCYLIARCERSHQRETWWVNRVALPLTVIWSALSLTMGPTTAEAYTILYETHCTWIYLLLVYGWMRILIKVIIRSVPIIGVCSLSPPLSSKH